MKLITGGRVGRLLAVLLMLGGAVRAADEVPLATNYDESEGPAAPTSVAAEYAADVTTGTVDAVQPSPEPTGCDCGGCGQCNQCNACNDCSLRSRFSGLFQRSCDLPCATPCPRFGGYGLSGIDSWRGVTRGSLPNNNGVINGFNLGGVLLDDFGIGWQAGLNYGIYNFSGNATGLNSQPTTSTQQEFVTIGLFRRADADRRLSWGIVHDWMISNNLGVYGSSPTLAQFRGQVAWALSAWNQIGLWGTLEDRYVTRATGARSDLTLLPYGPVSYQAIDQLNAFWDHQFGPWGALTRFYAGIPLNQRLAQTPSPLSPNGGYGGGIGSFIVGTNVTMPITNRLSGYFSGMYMKPSASPGFNPQAGQGPADALTQDFWNVQAGFMFSPGGNLRSRTIAGRTWMPYLPVANNGSFLTDASVTH